MGASSRGPRAEAERGVADAFRRILRALRLSANATQTTVGISPAQLYVLRHLEGRETTSISELARETLTDRSSVAAVVDRLVERGLARRSPLPTDRRTASVRITPAGERLLVDAGPAPMDLLVSGLHHMPAAELSSLARALGDLVTEMGLAETPAEMLFEDPAPAPRSRPAKRAARPRRRS